MKDMNKQCPEKETQTALKYVKRCSVSFKIKDRPFEPHPGGWQTCQSLLACPAGEAVGTDTHVVLVGVCLYRVLWESFLAGSLQMTQAPTL